MALITRVQRWNRYLIRLPLRVLGPLGEYRGFYAQPTAGSWRSFDSSSNRSWISQLCSGSEYFNLFETQASAALENAVDSGNIAEIQTLLDNGIDVNLKGRGGMTFLALALLHSKQKAFDYLLEKGANPNVQMEENGFSAISLAAMNSDPSYLRVILKYHGDPNLVNSKREQTPIYEAIAQLRSKNVDLLIASGANLNFRDRWGMTPLIAAATINQYDMVYSMLMAKADPSIPFIGGQTILSVMRRQSPPIAGSEQALWKEGSR